MFRRVGGMAEGESDRALRSFYLALLNGLMVRWLLDPERAPSGRDITEALRTRLEGVGSDGRESDRAHRCLKVIPGQSTLANLTVKQGR